ncbi:hypothetical protein JR316_0013455 [Psilocybe cubensis]|uniref:Uncharacterized protein n=2 Tax=Psilocybe cubensis TaxID=181762 RepID=A0A8H7XJT4_PSICU|nr:uncharacterized protein JR316_0013455 [Psilocybe cubensis]KAH9474292.1 hypothetical protein JR316_0013455 [Psilocybe cubensis]
MSNGPSTLVPQPDDKGSHYKTAAIVGGVIGGLVGLSLLIFLLIFFRRRRQTTMKRLTFDRDLMVQHRVPRSPPSTWIPGSSIFGSKKGSNRGSHLHTTDNRAVLVDGESTRGTDVEKLGWEGEFGAGSAGVDTGYAFTHPKAALGTGHIVPSPKGPRPSTKQANLPPINSPLHQMLQNPYPSQSPTQPVSQAQQHVLEWVQTQARPPFESPMRSELAPPPPTQRRR